MVEALKPLQLSRNGFPVPTNTGQLWYQVTETTAPSLHRALMVIGTSTEVPRLSPLRFNGRELSTTQQLSFDPLLSLEIDAHADVGGAFFEDVLTALRMELPYACDPMLIQIAIAGT